MLKNKTYTTSKYSLFTIYEPKERIIYKLPYYPDRIAHHAIMNIMEPIWTKIFINQTYSCIKNRGIHKLAYDLKKVLQKHPQETKYGLKIDIRKFYPSINHEILFEIIRRKIKDNNLLVILKEIIYSADGVPIGNYLSQFFANLYLTYFDHWVKEELKCKYYFRYADDIVILSNNKSFLRSILLAIKLYMTNVLKLKLKSNYQIYPIESRGIDFIGYKFYHTHILLRKSIKLRLFKLINKYKLNKIDKNTLLIRLHSYFGWLKFCNSKNLLHKIELETGLRFSNWNSSYMPISRVHHKHIRIIDIITYNKYYKVCFIYHNRSFYFKSKSNYLYSDLIKQTFPLNFILC